MQLGARIQQLLNEQGITQYKLATDLHLNPTTVNGYIRGRRLPDCLTLSEIARYLGTNVDYLLGTSSIKVYPQLSLSNQETDLLNNYRSMHSSQKQILEELSYALLLCDEHNRRSGRHS